MARKREACLKCVQSCLQGHGKNKISSTVTSFFKIMYGDQFSKILFLPPKFTGTVSKMVDKKTFLEDSCGQQWEVTISGCNGALAFQEGWNAFSSDHGLEVGYFVIFDYIIGSHFVVKIYDRSGCERVDFSEGGHVKKRMRSGSNTMKVGPCGASDVSMNGQGSNGSFVSGSNVDISQSHHEKHDELNVGMIAGRTHECGGYRGSQPESKVDGNEELYYIINRDLGGAMKEDRSPQFDIFTLEMPKNNSGADVINNVSRDKRIPFHVEESMRCEKDDGLTNKDLLTKEVAGGVIAASASDHKVVEKNNSSEKLDKGSDPNQHSCCDNASDHLLVSPALKLADSAEEVTLESKKKVMKCQVGGLTGRSLPTLSRNDRMIGSQKEHNLLTHSCQNAKRKLTQMSDTPSSIHVQGHQSVGKMVNIIKKEPIEMSRDACESKIIKNNQSSDVIAKDINQVHKLIKTEVVNSFGNVSPSRASISCLVAKNQSFMELPMCLPSSSLRSRKMTLERKVVFLRDPEKRLWPVLYHEKYGVNVLTSGWEAFSKANDMKPGDECVLGVENETEDIYEVSIRKS